MLPVDSSLNSDFWFDTTFLKRYNLLMPYLMTYYWVRKQVEFYHFKNVLPIKKSELKIVSLLATLITDRVDLNYSGSRFNLKNWTTLLTLSYWDCGKLHCSGFVKSCSFHCHIGRRLTYPILSSIICYRHYGDLWILNAMLFSNNYNALNIYFKNISVCVWGGE